MHRYVRPLSKTTAPTRMVCCVPEVDDVVQYSGSDDLYYRATAVWATHSRRVKDKWYGTDEPERIPRKDWWDWVDARIPGGARLYIVAPSVVDLATVTGFWRRLDARVYTLCDNDQQGLSPGKDGNTKGSGWIGRLITGNPPEIIHVGTATGTMLLVSLRNYTDAGWDKLATSVQWKADGFASDERVVGCIGDHPFDATLILTRFMRQTIGDWVRSDNGPWRDTIGQLSTSLWRRRFYTERVCRHEDNDAINLEKAACHGGRAETWYYGDIGDRQHIQAPQATPPRPSPYGGIAEQITRYDVSSQYPALLATELFPTRLVSVVDRPSVEWLDDALNYWGVIAHVRVRTDVPEIPRRIGEGSDYRIGQFETTLAGPELRYAIDSGYVMHCHKAAKYNRGQPLSSYATYLISERARRRDAKDYCGELFLKCLANAIGGKFAQRKTNRVVRPDIVSPWGRWGPWQMVDRELKCHDYQTIAGVVYELVDVSSAGKLLAALYAYLTAYGRMQMCEIRRALPHRSVVSQDTDGIWVFPAARKALQLTGMSADRTAGKLREVSSHVYARFFTPRHYYVDGTWVLSGYRHGTKVENDIQVCEPVESNAIRHTPYRPPTAVRYRELKRSMASLQRHHVIGSDGWLIPQTVGV